MTSTPDATVRQKGALARLVRACAEHPWRTVGVWLVILVAVFAANASFGGKLVNNTTIPGSEAQAATDLLEERFPEVAGDAAQIVFSSDTPLTDEAGREAVAAATEAASEVPGVIDIGDPYEQRAGALSEDGTIGFVNVQFDEKASELDNEQIAAAAGGRLRSDRGLVRAGRARRTGHRGRARRDGDCRRDRLRRRDPRAADRARHGRRDGAADHAGPGLDRRRHVAAHARGRRLRLPHHHPDPRGDDRPRRRHRLRAVHRHEVQAGAGPRQEPGRGVRHRRLDRRSRRHLRRHHGRHLDLRARTRRHPVRRADGLRHRHRGHRGGPDGRHPSPRRSRQGRARHRQAPAAVGEEAAVRAPRKGLVAGDRQRSGAPAAAGPASEPSRSWPRWRSRCSPSTSAPPTPAPLPSSTTQRQAYDLLAEGFGPGFNGPLFVAVDQGDDPEATEALAKAFSGDRGRRQRGTAGRQRRR